ncbi:MAG: DNA polymerase I [Bacillota bacterium]|nr:DNA polymerase I [Bacillota bacterium]
MKLLAVDGNSILNRAFYGIRLLSTKDGRYTNAVYGFLTMLLKIQEDTNPDAVAVAFDLRAPTFRHKKYEGYKAQRKGMPEELAQQLPVVKELLTLLGYNLIECEGYEADDILGTLANACGDSNNECVIATGDRDSLQLITDKVTVRLAATKMGRPEATIYDTQKILEDYGVTPIQLIDIKAIQGDSSDNIPGVPGIGEKGAKELIGKFGNIDYIYENIDTIDVKDGIRKKLIEGKDSAYLSRFLGEICKTVPIETNIQAYHIKPLENDKAARMMADLELFSLIDKFNIDRNALPTESEAEETKELEVSVCSDVNSLISKLEKAGQAVFLVEYEDGQIKKFAVYFYNSVVLVNCSEIELKAFFENEKILKQTHDFKTLIRVLDAKGIELKGTDFDTLLAAYLINPSASDYNIQRLFEEYAVPAVKTNNTPDDSQEFAQNSARLPMLIQKLAAKTELNEQTKLLKEIELPLSGVLARMENIGFQVNAQGIKEYGDKLQESLEVIEQQIYNEVGYIFNINSPKQLGMALFEKLNLPCGKKTKTGYSTSAEVLEELSDIHPVVADILNYRAMSKLKSTFCDGLLKVVAKDGRIHSNFNQTETRTGRISSTEPNLQNIPVRTEMGKELRRFFCAKEGCMLIDADYSQIELRVLAHIANDENMIEAFKTNQDIHATTASQVFNMPPTMVTPIMRSRAKAVNFGIVYGIGAFSLAKDIGVSRKQADSYIKAYLANYHGINAYMNDIVKKAKEQGYVETMFGRRRNLPELASSNFQLRSFGERVARNMPIQGTAADIIKIAMVRVEKRLKEEGFAARLILQVHDELIVEAPAFEAMKVAMILQEEMEKAVTMKVPIVAEASIGATWYDAKS